MLLQLDHLAFGGEQVRVECNRWVIRGAIFESRVDLGDARLPGGASLPALEFTDCTFRGGFKANAAHIERLTFENCSFLASAEPTQKSNGHTASIPRPTPLSLRHTTLVSELRLLDLSPYDEESLLWVDATGLRASSLTLRNVLLRAPQHESKKEDGYARYALDLTEADIPGDCTLMPHVELKGGLRLRSARIGGDLWARGIQISDGETDETRPPPDQARYALFAQAARIRGNFDLASYNFGGERQTFIAGTVSMWGLEVTGTLNMTGIWVDRHFQFGIRMARLGSLLIGPLQLPASSIRPRFYGGLYLGNTTIAGPLMIDAEIGELSLESAHVGGDASLKGQIFSLTAPRLHVEGDLRLAGRYGQDETDVSVVVRDATVNGQFDLSLLRFAQRSSSSSRKLDLRGMTVARTLLALQSSPVFVSARSTALVCAPEVVVIEAFFAADPESDMDNFGWTTAEGTYSNAATMFLSDRRTGRRLLIDGNEETFRSIISSLDIANAEAVKDYIRLYSACTWTGLGAISVVEKKEHLPQILQDKVEVAALEYELCTSDPETKARVTGFLRVSGSVYLCQCDIFPDGRVGMDQLQNKLIFDGNSLMTESRRYSTPYRYGPSIETSDYAPLNTASELDLAQFEREIPDWPNLLNPKDRFSGAIVDLRDASCNTLLDRGGTAWEQAFLRLENFTYKRVSVSADEIRLRSLWLKQRPETDAFTPQPYAELARVLGEQGDDDASREVERDKIHQQLQLRIRSAKVRKSRAWIGWIVWDFVYGRGFGYGLNVFLAARTILFFWLLGTVAVWQANLHNQITVNASTVSTQAISTRDGGITSTIPLASGQTLAVLPCGRAINPFLYAVEIFTPLLNLHQEARCDIREPLANQTMFAMPRMLELAKFIYELLGYVITSLAVLTFSGLARRWDQG
jgi:hypothetical protein